MNEKDNITEQLQELLAVYGFNKNTLSKYLQIPVNHVENLAHGNMDFLPDEPTE